MDVRALPVDPAARRFERERAELVKHKPHVLAPDEVSADAVSETDGHVDRSKARNPREEQKGKPTHTYHADGLLPDDPAYDETSSDESDGESHVLDVRV